MEASAGRLQKRFWVLVRGFLTLGTITKNIVFTTVPSMVT